MNKNDKHGKRPYKKIIIIESALIIFVMGIFFIITSFQKEDAKDTDSGNVKLIDAAGDETLTGTEGKAKEENEAELKAKAEEETRKKELLRQQEEQREYLWIADKLAAMYDYDGAIEHVKAYEQYEEIEEFMTKIAAYEEKKAACVPFGVYESPGEISHIFFHSLIADTTKAFDEDYKSNGYNYYMTTIGEFKEMMQQMYDAGYVLVSIHDVAGQVTLEDGTVTYKEGTILLPPDKKPFVLSQDDVNYYDYMDNDGFARRMVIDENGRPSTEMFLDDGSVVIGDYDMVPVLETFLLEHPDFSYKGARGIIALTGYEGTLGYRTDPASADSETYETDKKTVKEIADVMKEWGWEFACHSNGHRDMFTCTDSFLTYDTGQWLKHVGSLVGETDIYIFPYGSDIENTIGLYSSNKYKTLYAEGFRYFCGVYEKPWLQIRGDYVRMTRRPLDGQAMLQYPERLEDLFDLSKIIDQSRPALQ